MKLTRHEMLKKRILAYQEQKKAIDDSRKKRSDYLTSQSIDPSSDMTMINLNWELKSINHLIGKEKFDLYKQKEIKSRNAKSNNNKKVGNKMATKVMDQFTGKEKTLYTDGEKIDYHLGRVQDKNTTATKRAYSAGWLKANKKATKDFKKKNPDYVTKNQRKKDQATLYNPYGNIGVPVKSYKSNGF